VKQKVEQRAEPTGEAVERIVERISAEKLFADVHRDLIAWAQVTDAATTSRRLRRSPLSVRQLRRRLGALLRQAFSRRWLKAPRKENWRRPQRRHYDPSGRTSVQKAIDRAARRRAVAHRRRPRPGQQ
jgi:hypothetical protein